MPFLYNKIAVCQAIKYRLYPTTEQAVLFAKTFGCCHKVYNLMLADKIACYKETNSFGKQTPAMYKTEYPSSQICHCCGMLHPERKDLRMRTMNCECGLMVNRDYNSAINIKNEGLRILKTA